MGQGGEWGKSHQKNHTGWVSRRDFRSESLGKNYFSCGGCEWQNWVQSIFEDV